MPSPATVVRRCTLADVAAIRCLRLEMLARAPEDFDVDVAAWRAHPDDWWEEFTARHSQGGDYFVAIAINDGEAIGMVGANREGTVAEYGMLWVRATHRRHGIAGALLTACEIWASEHGLTEVQCSIMDANTASVMFHEHRGYIRHGTAATRSGAIESLWSRAVRWPLA